MPGRPDAQQTQQRGRGPVETTPILYPNTVIDGRFEIQSLTSIGGMGAVYRTHDRQNQGRLVALKVLFDAKDDRFEREAECLANLEHEAIVRYIAHGRHEGAAPYLAMEWLEGIDLRERLDAGKLSEAEAVALTRNVAAALGVAHARGIIHRDINPRNLFLVGRDVARVKILDFGIARSGAEKWARTLPGTRLGTPGYMAPEQARGAQQVDARADVFALGCVLFECVTGQAAFSADNLMALLAKVLFEEAPRAREHVRLTSALDDLISRMLSKTPARRPSDAMAVFQEILPLDDGSVPLSEPRSRVPDSLTESEQKLVCVVMASGEFLRRDFNRDGKTLVSKGIPQSDTSPLAKFGARAEWLADGSLVATLVGDGDATDHATQAARCALALRDVMASGRIVLATGRGVVTSRVPVGEVLDRAAGLLLETPSDPKHDVSIQVDEVTAALLDTRFEVFEGDRTLWLRASHESADTPRTVLGKLTSCVGRDRDLLTLQATFTECMTDSVARAVLLTGPAGMGKSRLRRELTRRLRRQIDDVEIVIGRADPMSAGAPYWMLAQAIRSTIGTHDGEPLAVRRQKLSARVARAVSESERIRVTEFLGELVGIPFPDESSVQLRAARLDSVLRGDQMRRAWEDWLEAECRTHPVVIVLEDLHWGDLPTVKLIDSTLRHLRESPLMVVATARTQLHELFPRIWEQRGAIELRLSELPRKAAERLVREVLGDGVDSKAVDRLVEHAAGNPLCLEELIRAQAEGHGDEIPKAVLAIVHARLERLDPAARRVLRAASVFGQTFWRGGVRQLLGSDGEAEVEGWLSSLVDRELIVKGGRGVFPGEEEYRFRHALAREAAYTMLTADDRALGHRLAAEWLESAGETDARVLAEHYERGGQPSRAARWYVRATEQALEGNDLEAVLRRADRGLPWAEGEDLGQLCLLSAEAHKWRGDNESAAESAAKALATLPSGSSHWCAAAGELAAAAGKLGRHAELQSVAEKLLALSTEPNAHRIIAMARTATQLILAGRQDVLGEGALTAAESLLRAIEARSPNDPAVLAWTLEAKAVRAGSNEDPGARVRLAEAAADHFTHAGDLRNACLQRVSVGYAYVEIGAYDHAEAALREALAIAERMGLGNAACVARAQLGRAIARQGRLAEGSTVEREAIAQLQQQKNHRLEGIARAYLAAILLEMGDLDRAFTESDEAVQILANVPSLKCAALATLAEIHLARQDNEAAYSTAERAMQTLRDAGTSAVGEARIRLLFAEALMRSGRAADARSAIEEAHGRLIARQRKITDPLLSRCFVENVPENAQTLARFNAWCGSIDVAD